MNYDTAKTNFESVVTRMQDELKEYANKPRASQAAIEARLNNINQLVEFYSMAIDLISEEQMKNMELQLAIMRYHSDAQRLVYWCMLHRANPDAMFYYTDQYLKEIYDHGIRFGRTEDLYYSEDPLVARAQDMYIHACLHAKKINPGESIQASFTEDQIAFMYASQLYRFNNQPSSYAQ